MSEDAPGPDPSEAEPQDHADEGDPDDGQESPASQGTGASADQTAEAQPAGGYVCDICGSPMLERHCKILCPACGYQRDCSDP